MKRLDIENFLTEEIAAMEKKKDVATIAGFVSAINDGDPLALVLLRSLKKYRILSLSTCDCGCSIGHPYE